MLILSWWPDVTLKRLHRRYLTKNNSKNRFCTRVRKLLHATGQVLKILCLQHGYSTFISNGLKCNNRTIPLTIMMKTTKRSLLIWIWLHKKPCEWLPRNIQQITPDRLWNTSNTSDLTCRSSIQSWSFVYTRWLPYFVVEYTWNCKAYSKKWKMQSVNKTRITRHEYNLMSLK